MSIMDTEFHQAVIAFTYYLAAFLFIALIVLAIRGGYYVCCRCYSIAAYH